MASATQAPALAAAAAANPSTTQLEFAQAMTDFKTMFPDMEKEVIEAVLRSNQGAVDATIDQLLAMSTDNQNEKLRNELDHTSSSSNARTANIIDLDDGDYDDNDDDDNADSAIRVLSSTPLSPLPSMARQTGASPKIKQPTPQRMQTQSRLEIAGAAAADNCNSIMRCEDGVDGGGGGALVSLSPNRAASAQSRWRPALLGPLPPGFLRLSNECPRHGATEFDIPDEQFALMLQNEEFMNELRWNPEFMSALEKEQHLHYQHQLQQQLQRDHQQQRSADGSGQPPAPATGDVAAFRERLRHMGKRSRKKFAMLARVFTWQRHKKPGAVRHPDSLPLREEHSDDDADHHHHRGASSSSSSTKQ